MRNFEGKVAVITGGASGIGRGAARALAREGAHIAVADLHAERMAETVAELEALGVRAISVACDVGRVEDIGNLRSRTLDHFGRVDILMNNAGVLPVGQFENTPLAEWEHVLRVNFLSVVAGVQAFLPDLAANGEGHVVNTASLAATFAYDPFTLAYNASKAAVLSLSEGLALALKPKGVSVTCLVPGPVMTNIGEQIRPQGPLGELGAYASANFAIRTPDDVGALVVEAIRSKRFFLPTNENVFDVLRSRAENPERFLAEIQAFLAPSLPAGKAAS
ncbi:MAG TPA: SDR family oxidoreductase [Novosphingobium sp.]